MAIINPYALAQSEKSIMESLIKAGQAQKESELEKTKYKGELSKGFEDQMAALQAQAQAILNEPPPEVKLTSKQKRRKKWAKRMGKASRVLGFIPGVGPAWSAALTGLSGGLSSYVQGIHGRDMSISDKKHALDTAERAKAVFGRIDPKYKRLFMSGSAKQFETEGQSYAQSLLDEARARQIGKVSDVAIKSLEQAGKAGLTSFVMDKAMKKGMEKMKEMKGLKEATGLKKGSLKKIGKKFSKEGVELSPRTSEELLDKAFEEGAVSTGLADDLWTEQLAEGISMPGDISGLSLKIPGDASGLALKDLISQSEMGALSNLTEEQFETLLGGQGLFKGLLQGAREGTALLDKDSSLLKKLLKGLGVGHELYSEANR